VSNIKKLQVPDGWSWTTLGKICSKPQYGWTTKANHTSGNIRLLRTTDISSGYLDWTTVPYCQEEPKELEKYLLKPGDIVISRAGSVGISYLINEVKGKSVFASYLIRFCPKDDVVDKKYVYYFLQSPDYWASIADNTSGIAVPNVNASKLEQICIPLAPRKDQERIVAEIEKQFSRLDESVTALKRIQANLKRYRASVLKAAVEGKLTEQWRKDHPDVEPADQLLKRILAERRTKWEAEELAKMKAKGVKPKDDSWKKKYKEPAVPDTANLSELPDGWVWARLGSLPVDVFDGPFGSNLKSTDYVSSGVRVIRLENIGSREFIGGKESYVTEKKYEQLKKHTVGHGDIIFSSFVANETRVVMLPGHIKKAINKADCFCVRINYGAINKRYLETFLATRTAYAASC
jgi:type I restriction enzyme S subunit